MTSPDEADQLDGAAGWAVDLMDTMGGPGAGLAIFVENLFPPIPSEVILPMAGFAARLGELSVLSAIIWTTAGSVLGAWMLYALGAWLGHDRIRRIVSRMPLMDGEDVDKTRTGSRSMVTRRFSSAGCCRSFAASSPSRPVSNA